MRTQSALPVYDDDRMKDDPLWDELSYSNIHEGGGSYGGAVNI